MNKWNDAIVLPLSIFGAPFPAKPNMCPKRLVTIPSGWWFLVALTELLSFKRIWILEFSPDYAVTSNLENGESQIQIFAMFEKLLFRIWQPHIPRSIYLTNITPSIYLTNIRVKFELTTNTFHWSFDNFVLKIMKWYWTGWHSHLAFLWPNITWTFEHDRKGKEKKDKNRKRQKYEKAKRRKYKKEKRQKGKKTKRQKHEKRWKGEKLNEQSVVNCRWCWGCQYIIRKRQK